MRHAGTCEGWTAGIIQRPLHKGAFYLPAYVEELLEDVEYKY